MRTTPSRAVAVFLCTVLLAVALGGTSAQQKADVALKAASGCSRASCRPRSRQPSSNGLPPSQNLPARAERQ